jgi:L-asparagine transporter-like permease
MSDHNNNFDQIIERERGLRRTLSARRMTMIAIGGAIGTGLFLGSGFAISVAGPGVLVSYAIGALIALLLMGCLAEMTVAHPTSGSFGAYAEHYIGPLAGFLVRYAYWTCIVLAVGTEVTAVALYMRFWFPAPPGWLWIVAFSALLITVNALSVNVFGFVEYWFSTVKVAAIIIFIALAGYMVLRASPGAGVGFQNYFAYGGPFPHGLWGVWVAVIMGTFSYLSIEMIAVAAGEAAQPEVAVVRAFRSTIVRLVLFYLLTLALVLAIVPWTAAGIDESPFVKVMRALGVPGAAGILNFVILIAALSSMNSCLYVTTRMMFSLARAGDAPRRLGELSGRGVPLYSLLLSSVGIALAAVLNVIAPQTSYILMVSVASFGALFTWMMIFVTHYHFRRARQRSGAPRLRFQMIGFPYTTVLGAGLVAAVLLTTLLTPAFRLTLVSGVPFLVCLVLVYDARYSRR